tara:strand:+ start:1961 stop:2197 length:237 start_codon:yes stop_codon:yes gene_type:complete
MEPLTSFVLIGTILSTDLFLTTVEFNLNPATNGGPSIAVLPNHSIPCEIKVGKKLYIVKEKHQEIPAITCEKKDDTSK